MAVMVKITAYCFLGCDTVQFGGWVPAFQRVRRGCRQQILPKCWHLSTKISDVTTQKNVI